MHTSQALHPIAIFDSGVGGLTVAEAIRTILPYESLLYLADTASSPFGTKSPEALEEILKKNLELLLSYPIKMIVIACHTACSCDLSIFKDLPIPVMTIFPTTLNLLHNHPSLNSLLVLGTNRTIKSQIYQNLLHTHFPNISASFIGCSPLERLIEEECHDHTRIDATLQELLHPLQGTSFDAVFLACTHFPIYKFFIQKALGPSCEVIDPALYFSRQIYAQLHAHSLLNPLAITPKDHYLISGDPEMFKTKLLHYFKETLGKTTSYFNHPYATL